MVKTIRAVYDGQNLVLDQSLNLPVDSEVEVSIEIPDGDAFQFIVDNAQTTGISDWSKNHDHYLYGIEKK